MPKVVIIGGSSEIGNAIWNEINLRYPEKYQALLKLSTTLEHNGVIKWNPETLEGVKTGLGQIQPTQGDIVIIALGLLGNSEHNENEFKEVDELAALYNVNLVVPALTMQYMVKKLDSLGGGKVILLSSTAAFPVLDNNFIYGSAKYELDQYAQFLQRRRPNKNTKICIVRSGFVQTKLNQGRTPTPFSRTAEEVATLVVNQMEKKIVWTPGLFKYVSFSLRNIPFLKLVAGKLVEKSKI